MSILTERDLEISIPSAIAAKKFDDKNQHGLTHCMKAVDFIVEFSNHYLFIEIKDPDDPNAKTTNKKKFLKKLISNELDTNLIYKYRDSFLYEWASKRTSKPIYYFILIALNTLTDADLLIRTESIKRKLPLNGSQVGWKRNLVTVCCVYNIATWKKYLPTYTIKRLSASLAP